MSQGRALCFFFAATVLTAVAAGTTVGLADDLRQHAWAGPDGKPLPFRTDSEALDFLRDAGVVSIHSIPQGITEPKKVLLERAGVQAHAIFRYLHSERLKEKLADGTILLYFRDSYLGEVAAYEVSRMLGMENVPPTVVRKVRRRRGSLQLWIEDCFDETVRRRERLRPDSMSILVAQINDMDVFDNLINNIDRNMKNMLWDPHWTLWLIDHTRAFGRHQDLPTAEKVVRISRSLWERLRRLDPGLLRARLSPYLNRAEVEALIIRLGKLIELIERRIARLGEGAVLIEPEPSP